MALIKGRIWPCSASLNNSPTRPVAGCRPLIHSRIAQESRARVFTLTFLLLEGCECPHQVAACARALQFSLGWVFPKYYFLSPQFDSQFGAFHEVQHIPNALRDRDLAFGRN